MPVLTSLLDTLAEEGLLAGWATVIYEPESKAFGGPQAMEIAHRLFHADSRHLLARAAEPNPPALGRTATVVVLISAMLRAAGLDWYEQGDVWAQFAMLRDAPKPVAPDRAATLTAAMRHLLRLDTWALTRDTTPLARLTCCSHGVGTQRFPLVARIRPACLPLNARVGRLCELADTGVRSTAGARPNRRRPGAARFRHGLRRSRPGEEADRQHARPPGAERRPTGRADVGESGAAWLAGWFVHDHRSAPCSSCAHQRGCDARSRCQRAFCLWTSCCRGQLADRYARPARARTAR